MNVRNHAKPGKQLGRDLAAMHKGTTPDQTALDEAKASAG